jgi:hypothetical protein
MARLILIIIFMGAIAPELTSLGRPYCKPDGWSPLQCGTFWWFVLFIALLAGDVAYTLYRGRKIK